MAVAYRIKDEPTGGKVHAALIVNPFWALLGGMLAGAWLGSLLFVLNAALLRGPTWRREILLAIAILIGSPLILFGLAAALHHGYLTERYMSYALLLIVTWKLSLAYWIYFLQQNAFALYEYFSGQGDNSSQNVPTGAIQVGVGVYLKSTVVALFPTMFWQVMVA